MAMAQMLHVAPETDGARGLVMCNCGTWFSPAEQGGWRCPRCHQGAVWALQPGWCPGCEQERQVARVGYDVTRVFCDCHLTPEQVARDKAQREARRRKEQVRREWEAARRRQDAEIAQHRHDSAECLANQGGRCSEPAPPRHPYAMCMSCRVNTERSTR